MSVKLTNVSVRDLTFNKTGWLKAIFQLNQLIISINSLAFIFSNIRLRIISSDKIRNNNLAA